jgi:DNA modification methylase
MKSLPINITKEKVFWGVVVALLVSLIANFGIYFYGKYKEKPGFSVDYEDDVKGDRTNSTFRIYNCRKQLQDLLVTLEFQNNVKDFTCMKKFEEHPDWGFGNGGQKKFYYKAAQQFKPGDEIELLFYSENVNRCVRKNITAQYVKEVREEVESIIVELFNVIVGILFFIAIVFTVVFAQQLKHEHRMFDESLDYNFISVDLEKIKQGNEELQILREIDKGEWVPVDVALETGIEASKIMDTAKRL